MITINEVISKLRGQLAQAGYEDDSILNDQYLYSLLKDAGSTIFRRIKDKWYKIPDWMYTTYPVPLEEVNEDVFPCEDIPDRCTVLESTFTIPLALTGRNKTTLRVFHGNKELPEYSRHNQHDPILSTVPSYKIQNSKLRIYTENNDLKGVTVSAVWNDNMEWLDKKYCTDSDTVECYNLDEIEFPLYSNPDYALMAHQLILQQLQLTLQQPNQNLPH